LRDANLEGAHLEGARLDGADLRNTILEGAHLDELTVLPDGSSWSPEADLKRFTDPEHPNFWCIVVPKGTDTEDFGDE
jgi:uncharacterized protein YjbI with pentapeptide repeats